MENLADTVRKFLLRNKVKVIFGTPCFGGLLHNGFFQSMLELSAMFTRLNIPFEVVTIGNESLIQRARNGIVAKFLSDDSATHLMFIDADITFNWISVVKLLISGKEFSGGCYPKKCFNWDKIKHHVGKNPNMKDDELMAKSLDYVFNPIYHKQGENQVIIRVENGMAQVKDIGTGFMMIAKSVIRKMIAKYPETKYRNNVAGYGNYIMNDCFYTLFDCCIDPVSKVYLSEDYLFCKRWIDMGGELWLDLNTNLNHTGIIDYKGCLAMTIGEVDMLNKDAQIMRAQAEKEKSKAASSAASTTSATTATTATTSTTTANDNVASESSVNKKKKNKKNKKKKVSSSLNDNNDSKDVNEESSNDEEETISDKTISLENQIGKTEDELKTQIKEGSHC
jgi:hypothetical protein